MDLKDKITIVTGASSGLGKAFSKAFIQKESIVYGLARNGDKLEEIHQDYGNRFRPVVMDITDHEAIKDWIEQTFSNKYSPDVLVNNAGIAFFADVDELTLEQWHSMIDTNLNGTFYMTRNIVPFMKRNENICHIVNIASIAGQVAGPKMAGYNASKFAIRGFTRAIFKELRDEGIKVTSFCPGSSNTHFFDRIEGIQAHENMLSPSDIAGHLRNIIESPDNFLVDEVVMRPLNPEAPEK
jgi:NADP-dependent 3-hydroxy acid dehydrogenase YdfG